MLQPTPQVLTPGRTTQAFETAIVVVHDDRPRPGYANVQAPVEPRQAAVGPLTTVAGVSLITRTLLSLQRAGWTDLILLCESDDDAVRNAVHRDQRIATLVRCIPAREFPLDDAKTWQTLGQEIGGACLIVNAQAVYSRSLLAYAKVEGEATKDVLAVPSSGETAADAAIPDLLVVPPGWLTKIHPSSGAPLASLMEQARGRGRLRSLPTPPGSARWWQPIRTQHHRREAERLLFRFMEPTVEGTVDRYFNRPAARLLTRLFLRAHWTPNAITVLSMAIGLIAAAWFAQGAYWAGVVGALLFQLAAIIDCCDGDVARLTFQESEFGGRLDLIGDNVIHMAIFAGLGWGAYVVTGSPVPLILAGSAIVGNGLSFWVFNRISRRRVRSAGLRGASGALDFMLHHVASRDFSAVLLIFALFGQPDFFLWLAAFGSHLFWLVMAWVDRSAMRRA